MKRLGAVMVLGLGLGALLAVLTGCQGLVNIPPGQYPTPPPGTPPTNPSPLCTEGNASECYHRPPGSPWLFNSKGGAPTVTGPAECPTEPPPTGCAAVPATGQVHEGGPWSFDADIRAAIQAAYRKAGGTADLISGPERPGEWRAFVVLVADELVALGYCVTYDYKHGHDGQASEMGARKGNRVEYFQLETTAGRIRTPPGAMRSWAEPACCEGQAIQRTAPAPKPTPSAEPDLTCRAPEKVEFSRRPQPAPGGEWVYDATFKAPDRARCLSLGKAQDFCQLGPDCTAPGEGDTPEKKALEEPRCPAWRAAKEACEDQMIGTPVWSGTAAKIAPQGRGGVAKVRGPGTLKVCSARGLCSAEVTVP